jgi:aryl carrier-like protein
MGQKWTPKLVACKSILMMLLESRYKDKDSLSTIQVLKSFPTIRHWIEVTLIIKSPLFKAGLMIL